MQEQAPTKSDTTTEDSPTRHWGITELDLAKEPMEPSPSWYLNLGVIHLCIAIANLVTLLYVEQSYSLSI